MNGLRRTAVLGVTALVAASGTGCVALDEHRQLQMSHKTLVAEKAQCESELYDARAVADSLRDKLVTRENELETKNQLVANLQAENDHLEKAFASAQATLERLAGSAMPTEPVVLERTKLPPALDSALKAFASQFPTEVEYNQQTGAVKWKSDVLFALGSDVVKDSAKTSLSQFAEVLGSAAAADFEVVVVGHTDDRPIAREATRQAHPTNWHLSGHRSIAVANVLLGAGYEPARVGVMGYGEYRPTVPNNSEDNRALNRRVEIYLVQRGTILGEAQAGCVLTWEDALAWAEAQR